MSLHVKKKEEQFTPFKSNGKMRVYLAAPFFSDEQRENVKILENILDTYTDCFSPSRDGTMIGPNPTREILSRAFNENVLSIKDADLIVAIINPPDTGTQIEIGMGYALGIPVICWDPSGSRKMNLMLAELYSAYFSGDIRDSKFIDYLTEMAGLHGQTTTIIESLKERATALNGDKARYDQEIQKLSQDLQERAAKLQEDEGSLSDMNDKFMELLNSWKEATVFAGLVE